mgnify:CR=1 FL=1
MKVCVDVSPAVHGRAGIGRYVLELVTALTGQDATAEYTIFYNRAHEAQMPVSWQHLERIAFPLRDKPWRLQVLLAHLAKLSQDHLFPNIALFHATDNLLPCLKKTHSVLTVHDLAFRFYPETFTSLNRWFQLLTMGTFLARAHAVIALSQNTKRDVMQLYGIDESKITVVYGGVNPRFQPASTSEVERVRTRYHLPERDILFVGSIEPRKNLKSLLAAFSAVKQQREVIDPVKLVIAGKKGWLYADFFQQLRTSGLDGEVILPGFIADEDLPALYSAADVFVFPSWYEGFGLPVLEAMACGAPVICSNVSSLPEVVGEAALMVAPDDIRGLSQAISRTLTDAALRQELIGRGLRQAAQFTWEKAAQQTLMIYEEVAARGGRKR